MKPIIKYTAIVAILSVQLAYDIVSLPVMADLAKMKSLAWAHDRYEAILADQQQPEDFELTGLNEIRMKAIALCDTPGVCENTIGNMQR